MPRVPYQYPEAGTSPAGDKIRERRGGVLKELDGVLLNAPHIAAGYSGLMGAVRNNNSLRDDVRELVMLRVAALNGVVYEWEAHYPLAQKAGMSLAQIAVVRDTSTALTEDVDPGRLLSDLQRAALAYTDWMTRNVHVPQNIFDALKSHVTDQEITEVTITVAAYNMVSRILVSLDVADKANLKVPEVPVEQE